MIRSYFFILLIVCGFAASKAQVLNEMLGRPTNTSITINVIYSANFEIYFEYGIAADKLSQKTVLLANKPDEPIEFTIEGLLPETRYFYHSLYRNKGETAFKTGETHSFITQRQRGSSFVFTMEADVHTYDKKGSHELFPIALQNQLNDSPDFMIDLGDTFGDDHNPTTITSQEVRQLQLNSRAFLSKISHSVPFYFCLGNHEGEFGYYLLQTPPNNLATYETLWRKMYYPNPYPNSFYSGNTEIEPNGIGNPENYYAWEWGDALIVVVDAYRYAVANAKPIKWDWTIGKTQYDWLKKTLETSTAKFKFVITHHILGQGRGGIELAKQFEWGGYDASNYKFDTYRPGWGMPIHHLMKANKVDIFFQGHDHIYVKQELDGIIYQTLPMPSDSSYVIGVTENGDAFTSGTQMGGSGHLRITVSNNAAKVEFVNAMLPKHETASLKNGQVLHSYTIQKSDNTTEVNNLVQSYELLENSFSLFPNPATNEFIIQNNQNLSIRRIIVASLEGKTIWVEDLQNNNQTPKINCTQLQKGVYLVRIETDKHFVIKKLIVQ